MEPIASISINIINNTLTPKTVLIFGRNYPIPLSKQDVQDAWQTIPVPSHGRATINYPLKTAVGVFYTVSSATILYGPHLASPGTVWVYDEEMENKAALMQDNKIGAPSDSYVIFNKQPIASSGRKISVGLFKDDKIFLVKRGVGVGNYVEMKPSGSLHICCMEIVDEGDDLAYFIAEFSPMTTINLQNYPQCLDLTIQQNEITRSIQFIPKAKS